MSSDPSTETLSIQTPARRTEKTLEGYRQKVRLIQHEAVLEDPQLLACVQENVYDTAYQQATGRQLLDAFYRISQRITPGSQTVYRAALLWFLRVNTGNQYHSSDVGEAYLELRDLQIKRPSPKSARPKDRPIYLSQEDLDLLDNELCVNRGHEKTEISIKTLAWLKAGIWSGLRPNEWEHARWLDNEKTILLAPNSKQRPTVPANIQVHLANQKFPGLNAKSVHDLNGLPIPPPTPQDRFRQIPIDPKGRVHVNRHLEMMREDLDNGQSFAAYYDKCRKRLERSCQKVFQGKKRYSLYVARHQFAANAKTKFPEHVVAQLMGHKEISTARRAYAASRYDSTGRGGQRPGEGQTQVAVEPQVTQELGPMAPETSDAHAQGA